MPRTASLTTIEAKIRELQAKAEAIKRYEKPGIRQLKGVLKKYRLTIGDVQLALGEGGARRASKLKGKKLKAKYRNPSDKSQTWAGRGIRPRWLVAALKGGKKLEDFAV
ncbi:MAG: H-NS histone family protein [Alphaproteobacteria bacterium]|nr:H-NS histone family protein [Alphaproteobacteria bacterium]